MDQTAPLFRGWDSAMVRACLQGEMGHITALGEDSAMASIGDFCFLAGRPAPELVRWAEAPILIPGGKRWARLIRDILGEQAVPFTRYATRRAPERFDGDKLLSLAKKLPEGFALAELGKERYPVLMAQDWSRDLCGNFRNGEDFARRGLGVLVLWDNRPVAGAASYAVCAGEIEIEIDTAPEFRGLGLAAACGAQLILNCLDRGLYPSWDAHDLRSLALAEKLGYQLDHPYPAYWVEEKMRG